MEIIYDPEKLDTVAIERLLANDWNPKDIDTVEYQHVLASLRNKGLRQPVIVREVNDHFEIIDGEQRWRGWKELNQREILIYNEGADITDQEAKELTISYKQQVPFDEKQFAQLLKGMTLEYENLELPIGEYEISDLIASLDILTSSDDSSDEKDDGTWDDMPEFEQGDAEPYQQIVINFESAQDVEDFAKLTDRTITPKTQYLNFPKSSQFGYDQEIHYES